VAFRDLAGQLLRAAGGLHGTRRPSRNRTGFPEPGSARDCFLFSSTTYGWPGPCVPLRCANNAGDAVNASPGNGVCLRYGGRGLNAGRRPRFAARRQAG